mgnify:CR=1 FL=1
MWCVKVTLVTVYCIFQIKMTSTALVVPPFKPIFCSCVGNGKLYDTPQKWRTHCNGKSHRAQELEKDKGTQQQLLTRLENEKSQLTIRVKELTTQLVEKNTKYTRIVTRAKAVVNENKTLKAQVIELNEENDILQRQVKNAYPCDTDDDDDIFD